MSPILNWRLGWFLLVAGVAWAIFLDPWSLGERDPSALLGSQRMAARHAQAVVLAMGFLQIAATILLANPYVAVIRRLAALFLVYGAVLYTFGYVAIIVQPQCAPFILSGAFLLFLGFGLLGTILWRVPGHPEAKAVLAILCLGMVLDMLMGGFAVDAEHFLPHYIGPEDGVRQRMLRLARVAATALSVVTLLYWQAARHWPDSPLKRWGRWGTLIGLLGMPTVLSVAALTLVEFKYLLPIPALAMTVAVVAGFWQARTQKSSIETFGWLLLVVSINVGLTIGLYAFDGPLPSPGFIGGYNDFLRRLTRLGHAYVIVFGLLAIVYGRIGASPLARGTLALGSIVTLLGITVVAVLEEPTWLLSAGPILVAVSLLAVWRWPQPVDW